MKTKKLLLLVSIVCTLFISKTFAQQNVVISDKSNAKTEPSAILKLDAADKGFLMPEMNFTDLNKISSPVNGLIVYVTDKKNYYYYDSTAWKPIGENKINISFLDSIKKYSPYINYKDTVKKYTPAQTLQKGMMTYSMDNNSIGKTKYYNGTSWIDYPKAPNSLQIAYNGGRDIYINSDSGAVRMFNSTKKAMSTLWIQTNSPNSQTAGIAALTDGLAPSIFAQASGVANTQNAIYATNQYKKGAGIYAIGGMYGLRTGVLDTVGNGIGIYSNVITGIAVKGNSTFFRNNVLDSAYGYLGECTKIDPKNIGTGVRGIGLYGISGATKYPSGYGVYGENTYSVNESTGNGIGVMGLGFVGVNGTVSSNYGIGVLANGGTFNDANGTGMGVQATGYYAIFGQTDSLLGYGVAGVNTATGNLATGVIGQGSIGVSGESTTTTGTGVTGSGAIGVSGKSTTTTGTGVNGEGSTGILGKSTSTSGKGIDGSGFIGVNGTSSDANGYGISGFNSNYGIAIKGKCYFTNLSGIKDSATGFIGLPTSGDPNVFGMGVAGVGFIGVTGESNYNTSTGVYGQNSDKVNTGGIGVKGKGYYGIVGVTSFANGVAILSDGDFKCTGVKNFRIDHPLDPENKYLLHASIESPEVLNLYRGNVTLDANGEAVVNLPDYFKEININFSYNLTSIGSYQPVYVKEKVNGNQFVIAGGKEGTEISWTLYAERNDLYVQKHPESKQVEQLKPENERGKYQRPELYNQPECKGIFYSPTFKLKSETTRNKNINSTENTTRSNINIHRIKNNGKSLLKK